MANTSPYHEIVATKCYKLGAITYVPHYTKKHIYVAPGGAEFDEDYMILFGATPERLFLWPRETFF